MQPPTKKPASPAAAPEQPPEEAFWERYSPHHEFPLSTVTSVGLFGLAVGLVAVASVLIGLSRNDERGKPPKMDVVEEAQGGGGKDGFGPEGAGLNAKGGPGKAENVPTKQQAKADPPKTEQAAQTLKNLPDKAKLTVKNTEPEPKVDSTGQNAIGELRQQAEEAVKVAMEQPKAPEKGPPGKKGLRNPGEGGGFGGGKGKGFGTKEGPGTGNDPNGVVRTKRQRRELRWRIYFSGTGEQHLAKLRALAITLALPTRARGQFQVWDLTSNPPHATITDLRAQQNKIKWISQDPKSLPDLARALRLREIPPYAVIFLPQAVEEEMIQLEHDYKGLEENQIKLTEFEIRRRPDGGFSPVVISQTPR
jgi:hypothetical protein